MCSTNRLQNCASPSHNRVTLHAEAHGYSADSSAGQSQHAGMYALAIISEVFARFVDVSLRRERALLGIVKFTAEWTRWLNGPRRGQLYL
jgi:hypothetical protein